MLKLLKSMQKLKIEFVCDPADRGVLAEPVPARAVLPEWFKRLPPVDRRISRRPTTG